MILSIYNITALTLIAAFFLCRYFYTAVKGKRDKTKTTLGIMSGRLILSLFAMFLIPLLIIFDVINRIELRILEENSLILYLIGLMLGVSGLVFMTWARVYRQNDWGFMGDQGGEVLFTYGPYAITRHPYYIGAILVGVGIYLVLNSWLVLIAVPVISFILKVIKKEDCFLKEKFGNQWVEYRSRVGIIPWGRF